MNKNMTKETFANQNEVRWCPGCGDYAILSALQKTFAQLGLVPEEQVIVSGIGCSGRLPYYMNVYGYHTIHGRATAVASGLKLTRPDLNVWIITGDGDALSIGANHLMHLLRRNINLNILMFNNQVYGLTKGQFSPTSPMGQITKTSLEGVKQRPVNPLLFALGAGATFVARCIDKDPAHMAEVMAQANAHPGASFIEIYQDCHVFNSGAFDDFSTKPQRQEHVLYLSPNAPMHYKNETQALTLVDDELSISANLSEAKLHQPQQFQHAMRLARLQFPQFPVPVGVLYQETAVSFQLAHEEKLASVDELERLYRKGASWVRTSS